MVIDTDMAYDDWIALLYVLQRPELSVKAITVNGTGESHCEPGVRNALALIKPRRPGEYPRGLRARNSPPGRACLSSRMAAVFRSLNDLVIPDGENTAQQTDPATHLDAAALLRQVIQASPEKVTLLTLGALTNIGEAIQQDPTFLENISQVYIMGGALEVLGNVQYGSGIDNQVAEWNIYIDPLALKILLDSGAPVTFVPLDATNQVPANMDFFGLLRASQTTPEARFVNDLLLSELDVIASGINSFWDPLTAAILADESLATIREGKLKSLYRGRSEFWPDPPDERRDAGALRQNGQSLAFLCRLDPHFEPAVIENARLFSSKPAGSSSARHPRREICRRRLQNCQAGRRAGYLAHPIYFPG